MHQHAEHVRITFPHMERHFANFRLCYHL
jgi:hypothetical protein